MIGKAWKTPKEPCPPGVVRLSINWEERMGVKGQQLGFSDWEGSWVRKQTRKEKFLCEMETVLPF